MRNRISNYLSLAATVALSSVLALGQAAAPAATFNPDAGTLGAIPDGPAGCTAAGGTPKNVTFTVSGLTGSVSTVEVNNFTFGSPVHTWMADVEAVLIAPNGASHTLFGRTGATTATSCGDSSDLAGPYNFTDAAAAPPSGGWWQAATAADASTPLASGSYRTTGLGGAGATNPMPATTMNSSFTGVANANGTWTLRLIDHGGGDTGAISAATLAITTAGGGSPVQHIVDYDGDGKTDASVVRNTGGGPAGQITWYNRLSSNGSAQAANWGLATDFFVPADYDGDGKTDVSVWRPGASGVAGWYTFLSATSTVRAELYGQTGDDPTVVGDYDGDGKDDIAIYRAGAASGDQSLWAYRTAVNGVVHIVQWGQNGDFPAPGDYDGDGKNDFSVQRNVGSGQAGFFTLMAAGPVTFTRFGTPTDVIVPGDYDGDGKTDVAVIRGSGGQILWFYLPSSGGSYVTTAWGASATDFPVQGDYDGDGKTDQAVWRPNADPTQNFFYVNKSSGGLLAIEWGQNGDYPVANYNSH